MLSIIFSESSGTLVVVRSLGVVECCWDGRTFFADRVVETCGVGFVCQVLGLFFEGLRSQGRVTTELEVDLRVCHRQDCG